MVSVHDHLPPFLLTHICSKAEHYGGEPVTKKVTHLKVVLQEGARDKTYPSKTCPQGPSSNQDPSPSFHHLPIMTSNYESIDDQCIN
jgi:hypothetical protein